MAQGWISVCTNCGDALEGWDEGNPWTKDGVVRIQMPGAETLSPIRKEYIYHPSPRNVRIMGNDVRHLCVDCGRKFYCDVIVHWRPRASNDPPASSAVVPTRFHLTNSGDIHAPSAARVTLRSTRVQS